MNKKLLALIIVAIILIGGGLLLQTQNIGSQFIWKISGEGQWLLPLIGVAALLDSINPCSFSVLLLTIAFLFSIGRSRSGVLKIGSAYILGLFLAYFLIGLGILQALHLFNTPYFMSLVGAWLLITLGAINVINEFFPRFPIKLKIPSSAHRSMAKLMDKASLPAVFILGALVGLCEFPCTGGPYLLVLGLLHDQGTYLAGFGYLWLYNLIFILPLVVILLISANESLVAKVQAWQKKENLNMRLFGGLAMVALGLIILFI